MYSVGLAYTYWLNEPHITHCSQWYTVSVVGEMCGHIGGENWDVYQRCSNYHAVQLGDRSFHIVENKDQTQDPIVESLKASALPTELTGQTALN